MEIEKAVFPGNKRHLCVSVQRKRKETAKTTIQIPGQATVNRIKNLCALCSAVAAGDRGRLKFGFKIMCQARL